MSAFIANFQSPYDLDEYVGFYYSQGYTTNLGAILQAAEDGNLGEWTVPRGGKVGDRAFFMCGKNSQPNMRRIRRQAKETCDEELIAAVEEEFEPHQRLAGTIVAMGRIAAQPYREPDAKANSLKWAPIRDFVFLKNPIGPEVWKQVFKLSTFGSITNLSQEQEKRLEEIAYAQNPDAMCYRHLEEPVEGKSIASIVRFAGRLAKDSGTVRELSTVYEDGTTELAYDMSDTVRDFDRTFFDSGLLDRDYDQTLDTSNLDIPGTFGPSIDIEPLGAETLIAILTASICDEYYVVGSLYANAVGGLLDRCLTRIAQIFGVEAGMPTDAPHESRERRRSLLTLMLSRETRRFLQRIGIRYIDELEEIDEDYLVCNGATQEMMEELRPHIGGNAKRPLQRRRRWDDRREEPGDEVEDESVPQLRFRHMSLDSFLESLCTDGNEVEDATLLKRAAASLIERENWDLAVHSADKDRLLELARESARTFEERIAWTRSVERYFPMSIERLELDGRTMTTLSYQDIETVGDLCTFGQERMSAARNCGPTTLRSIRNALRRIDERLVYVFRHAADDYSIRAANHVDMGEDADLGPIDTSLFDVDLDLSELSDHIRKALRRRKVLTVGQALELGEQGLASALYVEDKAAREILRVAYRQSMVHESLGFDLKCCAPPLADDGMEPPGIVELRTIESASEKLERGSLRKVRLLVIDTADVAVVSPLSAATFEYNRLGESIGLRHMVSRSLLERLLCSNPWGVTEQELLEVAVSIDEGLDSRAVDMALQSLLRQGRACRSDALWRAAEVGLEEAIVSRVWSDRDRKALCRVLAGSTVAEVGKSLHLSARQVEQMVRGIVDEGSLEDTGLGRYLAYLLEYELDETEATVGLGMAEQDWEKASHLCALYDHERRSAEELLASHLIPLRVRLALEEQVFRDYVAIGEERVKATPVEMALYVLKNHGGSGSMNLGQLQSACLEMLDAIGRPDDYDLLPTQLHVTEILSHRCVLGHDDSKMRFFDYDSVDMGSIVKELGLDVFEGKELSCELFVRTRLDLLEEYDVHDAAELHSLLSTYAGEMQAAGTSVGYAVGDGLLVSVGTCDRRQQVQELATELSPIPVGIFANAYEKAYGISWQTFMEGYLPFVADHVEDGIIRVQVKTLTSQQRKRMDDLLTDDYYRLMSIRRLYANEFPADDPDVLNANALDELGFATVGNYALRKVWTSEEEYFGHLLQSTVFFGDADMGMDLSLSASFQAYLRGCVRRREMLPYGTNEYISALGLQQLGFDDDMLLDFATCAATFCADQAISYCTVKSLQLEGFDHDILPYALDDSFYNAVLCSEGTRFTRLTCNHRSIACLDDARVAIGAAIDSLVDEDESIEVEDLKERAYDRLGVEVTRQNIISAPTKSDLYYCDIADIIYKTKDLFYKEVLQ